MVQSIRKFALLAIGVAAAGCATDSGTRQAAERAPAADDCLFSARIDSWTVLDNRRLIVYERGRRPYEVQLFRPVPELAYEFEIGFYDTDGRLCPYGGDAMVLYGLRTESIPIVGIRQLTPVELDSLFAETGRPQRRQRSLEQDETDIRSLPPEEAIGANEEE